MRIRIILTACLFVMFALAVNGQDGNRLDLKSGRSVPIANDTERDVISVKVRRERIRIHYDWVGKANPIHRPVLEKIRRKNPKLYRQLNAIRTSYSLSQQDRKFYIRAMRNVIIDDQDKRGYLDCEILLLELNTKNGKRYIPVITKMKRDL